MITIPTRHQARIVLIATVVLGFLLTAAPATGASRPSGDVDTSGLVATITSVSPTSVTRGKPLQLRGTITNTGDLDWKDVQVYLTISHYPATDKEGLNSFAAIPDDQGFAPRIFQYGLFDSLGDIPPGTETPYHLSVPYQDLKISGAPGVYHVGVSVLGTNSKGRDLVSDARADTLVPLLPRPSEQSQLHRAAAVLIIPFTAPVRRVSGGPFLDDSLATLISPGGRLRHSLDFALQAPPHTLQLLVDPALIAALTDMSTGYTVVDSPRQITKSVDQTLEVPTSAVTTGTEAGASPTAPSETAPTKPPGRPGSGEKAARTWLADFETLAGRQSVALVPWAVPAADTLVANHLTDVVTDAVISSQRWAENHHRQWPVVAWQRGAALTPEAMRAFRDAGVRMQLVPEKSVPDAPTDRQGYPAPVLRVDPGRGDPLQTVVVSHALAGEPLTEHTTALQLRQSLLADTVVRSLNPQSSRTTTVAAVPYNWDPGPPTPDTHLSDAFAVEAVLASSLGSLSATRGEPYGGPVKAPADLRRQLSTAHLTLMRKLHTTGTTFIDLLTAWAEEQARAQRRLSLAASTYWSTHEQTVLQLMRAERANLLTKLAEVNVSGPPFVAMSSDSGRFPLTITNGLQRQITVQVKVLPDNPALNIKPIEPVDIEGGGRHVVQVISTAEGSGLTSVHARLATVTGREFGQVWKFDVRATHIGMVIWVVMGVGLVVLFGAALYRITVRLRNAHRARGGRHTA